MITDENPKTIVPDEQDVKTPTVGEYVEQFDPIYYMVFKELIRAYANNPQFHEDMFTSLISGCDETQAEEIKGRMEYIGDYITRQAIGIAFKYVDNRAEFIASL